MELLFLSGKDVESLMSFELAYKADEEAYKAFSSNQAIQPPITNFRVDKNNGEFNIKTAYSGIGDMMGSKIIGGFPDNAKLGLPAIMGIVALYDGKTGAPVAILDGSGVTYYRTASAGAYAAKLLAKPDSDKLAIIGTGTLSRMMTKAMLTFFPIKKCTVKGIVLSDAEKMCNEMKALYPEIEFIPCEGAKEAVEDADIICTTTISREPIVMKEWVKPGAHINAFGADAKGKQELDPELIATSKVVVDVLDECIALGECQHAINAGMIKACDIYAEIGEIALGRREGRTSADEITVFDSTGIGLQDICTCAEIYKAAKEQGVGTVLDL